jgi:hypothetical protein
MSRMNNNAKHWRWLVAVILVALLAALWLSGAGDTLTLEQLKLRQHELEAWTGANPGSPRCCSSWATSLVTALSIPAPRS